MGVLGFPVNAIVRRSTSAATPYASFLNDPVGAALAAHLRGATARTPAAWPWDLQSTMPNVEDNELFYPLLYLWRRELPDSGGAGKLPRRQRLPRPRLIPHKTDKDRLGRRWPREVAVPGPGCSAAIRPRPTRYQPDQGRAARPSTWQRTGRDARDPDELEGEPDWVRPQSRSTKFTEARRRVGLQRGPGPVATATRSSAIPGGSEDVAAGRVTRDWASKAYGVSARPARAIHARVDRGRDRTRRVGDREPSGSPGVAVGAGARRRGQAAPAAPDGQVSRVRRDQGRAVLRGPRSTLGPPPATTSSARWFATSR